MNYTPIKKNHCPQEAYMLMGRRKTISKQYTWQTKCPWTNEEIAVHLYNRTSLQHKEMNRDTQQHGWPSKTYGECKKPDTKQHRIILFTRNSRKVKSAAVEGRWVIAGDWLPRKPSEGAEALYTLSVMGAPGVQLVSVWYLHLECCGGGYTGVHTFVETHKSVHLKGVYYRDVPGDLVVKTPRFQCRGLRLDPGLGTKILQAMGWSQKTGFWCTYYIMCKLYHKGWF